ncbi:NADH pyrophosphatase [Hartmannibacter diazotrophicus]|uniref:NADH pyrophosphatase n=1 Tax=Hartmannibacter diazotrophicus TaxID=1482074 RepID=A0A2C9DBK0_9HYPH|nr:NUDIX hydrolase [Hartmannibacter diazotrophicus]SON57677.1 NADH pyrophosphatase [Hartmannibacter diazotrophicus]
MTDLVTPSFETRIPEGDERARDVCTRCGFIAYENPKIVVGSVVRAGDKVLLCRRAIDPQSGFWTLPAGFMELNETPEQGAAREAYEEARASIEIHDLLAIYTIPRISQVQLIYRATLKGGFAPGPESLEVDLFSPDDIPRDRIAFPSVHWALDQEARWRRGEAVGPFMNPVEGL